MRRYLALIFLLVMSIPAGMSVSGCIRNPAGNYCNGLGYGLKNTDVYSIDLEPRTTGISIAFGQTRQISAPTAKTCKGTAASVAKYAYGTTNNQIVDISPTGSICAGTWNRNSGGGIADFTTCNPTGQSGEVFVIASGGGTNSNPLPIFVHPVVTSVELGNQLRASPSSAYLRIAASN